MADPLKTSAPGTRPVSATKADSGTYAMYAAPLGVDRGTCDRSRLSREAGNLGRTALVGAQIGRSMDQIDQACVARILEYAPDRAAIRWYGAAQMNYGGPAFAVTPLRTFERDGKFCREYQTLATINGHDEQSYGVACRMTDGVWQTAG